METYEDHSWGSYSNQSEDDDEDNEDQDRNHHRNHHLAKVRSRSNSRCHRRSSFLVDELDMLMDKAATTIQATWRGHQTRRQLMSENAAAATIQAAWRRFITREYLALQREQLPPWQRSGRRRRTPSPVSFKGEERSWDWAGMDEDRAAEVIQAHYRGYVTRRAFCECKQAAVTIQAHWRGYRTRQELARRRPPVHPPGGRRGTYYGHPSYMPGSAAWVGPYPRKHWRKCLVGDPEEWSSALTGGQHRPRDRERRNPAKTKTCPQCGRCTSVRVLVGVGKGPTSESEVEESEHERRASRSPSGRPPKASAARAREQQEGPRQHPYRAHVSYQVTSKAQYSGARQVVKMEVQPRKPSRDPGGYGQCYAATHKSTRSTRERTTTRSLSSTSVQLPDAPSPGTSDWLYQNYCTRRAGEGQRRVFKTRKQLWQIARAATLIQSFWRGWKARQALRVQQEAATKIQSAYRGYKTRIYLIEAGVLSEGDTE
ncbi:hypothetical protein JRQ81_010930 [Phrynocephalus forsythii]|uniref:Uncharacterized protein n=1 Tax=Phrynocephalus forsythii TaxID=171643 RepID=A0A9Q0Y3Q0_9SAUR|nr:hypothetical protein JRQ81_010930 [Phrynocephalus forsythii]